MALFFASLRGNHFGNSQSGIRPAGLHLGGLILELRVQSQMLTRLATSPNEYQLRLKKEFAISTVRLAR